MPAVNVPCGSWRVLKFIEGKEAEVVWCDRQGPGPCQFPGTFPAAQGVQENRPCLAEGGRQ